MSTSPRSETFFGLLELDAEGTVLYFKPERQGDPIGLLPNFIGENFFTAVMPVANVKELKERFTNFRRSHAPALSFNFIFSFEHGTVPARVLLARIHDRSELGTAEFTLVHLRKASSPFLPER
ncbi:MAG TPA: hypothetical protein VGO91_11350 [Pyrinomonadaceae bacterium]|jgi:hypothetical protein|nr:hypothetical protein [Pyrinomonadaceae bacterium]